MIWLGFLLLTSLSRNHIFSEHSWSLPRDFQAWCPCGWSWSCGGTWRPGGSGRGTPWCGLRWDAEATRWSCEGHSALARLWGRFLGKSRCVEAEKKTQIRYLTHGISFYDPEVCQHSHVHVYLLRNRRKQKLCVLFSYVCHIFQYQVLIWDKQENPCSPNLLKLKLKGIQKFIWWWLLSNTQNAIFSFVL